MHQGDYSMTADFPKGWINTVTTAYLLILIVMEKLQQEMRIKKTCKDRGGSGKDATRNQDPEKMQQKMRIRKHVQIDEDPNP